MTPERWETVKQILTGALARAPYERSAFLNEACAADPTLRQEVESLLEAGEQAGGFLEPPPPLVPRGRSQIADLISLPLSARYTIERELGHGGMATVYLARDLRHARSVALKVLHPNLSLGFGAGRFEREIRVTASLDHPHILPVLDSGEAAGLLWYTMPHVAGDSLRTRLQAEAQLPVEDAVRLLCEVADALECAHRHGIVHRDIKPENILLSHGHARVADFGIAHALEAAGALEGERLTASGFALGTPGYMGPEQASGGPVDARSDVYALGCVGYEMLAGEPPFTGITAQAVAARHAMDPVPSLRIVRPAVSAELERVLHRALAKAPADRFQTASAFGEALTRAARSIEQTGLPAATPPATVRSPAATSPTPMPEVRAKRMRGGVVALVGALLLVIGIVFLQRHGTPQGAAAVGPVRMAVLPFENLGRADDEYFAEGITDEVRGKLAALTGLEVIARASSDQYKGTTKSPRQIGGELGVQYLLTGTVRWEKGADGSSRVRVSPELVQVSTASTKWQAPFEAPLTGVFRVQADVATQVAEALGLVLGTGERERLAQRPTENLAAYEAFLKAEAAYAGDLATRPQAIDYYERAVALDSTFALAWARLAEAQANSYWTSPTNASALAARTAAERSLAISPRLAQGHLALAFYHYGVRHDLLRAHEEAKRALQLAPKDARILVVVAANELALGNRERGLERLREVRALDPRSAQTLVFLTSVLSGVGRYDEALEVARQGLAFAPTDLAMIHATASIHLARGDLAAARSIVRAVPKGVDPASLVAYFAYSNDLYWVLDEEQQRLLLRLSPAPFGDDRAGWAFALAQTHALRGDSALARAYADSARSALEARLREVPLDATSHTYLGLALGYLGRKSEAIREGRRGLELMPASFGAQRGDYELHLARIYVLVGEREKSLDLLERLVRSEYVAPGWLRINPAFRPLRGNPRFERLVSGG